MMTQFRILISVNVRHGYYREDCRDFDFFLPSDAAKLVRNHKLLTKVRDGKLYILYEADQTGNPLISAEGKTIRVGLKLLNPHFSNITDLAFLPGGSTPVYANIVARNALDAPANVPLVGRIFSHKLSLADRPVTVSLDNDDGETVRTDEIKTADQTSVSYDLSDLPVGKYSVEEWHSSGTSKVRYYSDRELLQQSIFAIVEIKIDRSFYAAAPAFAIPFSARKDKLKYYLVARKYTDADMNRLSVTDSGYGEDGRTQVTFTKVNANAFTAEDIAPSLLGGSDVKVVLFKSQADIERREKARRNIKLTKNGDELVQHLPQPGPDAASGNIIIRISKP